MKVCPNCSFSNEECFPTCVFCNTLLTEVLSTPSADPNHPEHEQRKRRETRHRDLQRQFAFAALFYAILITLTAGFPGFVRSPLVLLLYFLGGGTVAMAIVRGFAGQFTGTFAQTSLSLILLLSFGPVGPMLFFMLAAHALAPVLFWYWTDSISTAN